MIERHEVEALLTLAEELHFGRTAERLHITTARVSQTIRKLERQVGAPLFHRTSRRVELTPVGRTLVADVRPAWQAVGVAVQRAIDTGRGLSGSLSVAFVGAAAGQLLVGAAQVFRDRAPGCEVRIREAQASELVPWLRDGEVDLGLNTFPVHEPDIVCGPVLVREARMLAVPVGHPLARRGAVSVEDLARCRCCACRITPPCRHGRRSELPSAARPFPPAPWPRPSRKRSRSSEPGRESCPSAPTPGATTRGPTSSTSPSATLRHWSGA